jgi:predicted dehydrogenase
LKNIGLMGCGLIADYGHIPAINETPGLRLVSLYDPDPARAYFLQGKHNVPHAFTNSEAFFASDIDAVAIASPAPCHRQNVEDAARWGKPVLCEKPLAMTDHDAESMIATMENAGLLLAVGFCYRFSTVSMKIKELVQQRAIGDVRALRLIYVWNLHGKWEWTERGERLESPRRVGRMLEGGPMVDCGVHQIDLSRWWLGSEVVRHQQAGAWVEDYEAPDHVWLHMDHESGAHTAVEMSFSYTATAAEPRSHFSYHLIGTDGLIRFDRDGWHFEVRTPHGTQFLPGGDEKNFVGMYAAFAQALETGERGDLATGRDGLIATRIARSATQAVIANRSLPK